MQSFGPLDKYFTLNYEQPCYGYWQPCNAKRRRKSSEFNNEHELYFIFKKERSRNKLKTRTKMIHREIELNHGSFIMTQ